MVQNTDRTPGGSRERSPAWTTVLVLGGIRSGKSEYAESLVADALAAGRSSVRYLATAQRVEDDPGWAERIEAHQRRRPQSWATQEIEDATDLLHALGTGGSDEVLLVDDLGGWAGRLLPLAEAERRQRLEGLAWAVGACRSALIMVSSEVGLSLVPATEIGAQYADLLGDVNQIAAREAGRVALIVAGTRTWLKEGPAPVEEARPEAPARPDSHPAEATEMAVPDVITPVVAEAPTALSAPTMALPMISTGLVIQANMELPLPDDEAERDARAKLATLDVPGAGFGRLERIVRFAAATQRKVVPDPWRSVRMLLLYADHDGDIAAGVDPADSAYRAGQARRGEGAIGLLAARAGATIQVVDAATAGSIEWVDAATPEAVEAGLRHGWRLAEEAIDSGVDLIVLGSCGAGADTAAATVVSLLTSAEVAGLIGRRVSADGRVDDPSWMKRCAAARDALHRVRGGSMAPKDVLASLGGVDLAIAVGVQLGATARRTPVLMDGPVGVAAGLVARDLAGQARHWALLPDHGGDPATKLAADVLGLEQFIDLRIGVGEGATALALLPLLQSTLTLASTLMAAGPPAEGKPAEDEEPAGWQPVDDTATDEPADPDAVDLSSEETHDAAQPATERLD
ncbi:bifunctional adenosylcobinamide kinase/adenosylcobinamide-phosphate guanylyltransferase [Hamadaea tsunoensis]|uniref:bifunctional adenosylcobinamide kinase/adenosylcobinamide-phosphate guanylyltransferase n=1 Tax=Hamadaea tsunoensis TaxID=53368 RepID=UPI0006882A18|nr:bifunctional adenosylcobinamide kinase/adenosylcobinamide-phosphate guanylyltransferase [Hamadaea tsunoensis]